MDICQSKQSIFKRQSILSDHGASLRPIKVTRVSREDELCPCLLIDTLRFIPALIFVLSVHVNIKLQPLKSLLSFNRSLLILTHWVETIGSLKLLLRGTHGASSSFKLPN